MEEKAETVDAVIEVQEQAPAVVPFENGTVSKKKGRPHKDACQLSIYARKSLYNDFTMFCEKRGHTKTWAAEHAIEMYINGEFDDNSYALRSELGDRVYQQVQSFCSKHNISQKQFLEEAILNYISVFNRTAKGGSDA